MTEPAATAPRPEALEELSGRLDALAQLPVGEHPAVLEAVHRGVVAELDALGATARARRDPEPG